MERRKKELHWFAQFPEKNSFAGKNKQPGKPELLRGKNEIPKDLPELVNFALKANQWVDEIAVFMKADEKKELAWRALRSVLHAIRDRLTPEEAFQLSAQLPMLIRGLYFEGYHYRNKPEKFHVEELKKRIEKGLGPALLNMDTKSVFKAVLLVLYNHVSIGEMADIYAVMPPDIKQLWDESLQTYTV